MRSVRTTFHILEAVAENQPIGLSELARRLELPKSTVQRSLATLADLQWIRPDAQESTRWTIGDKVRSLSEQIDDLGRLREAALPVLERLNSDTLETIHLGVYERDTMRLIERQDSKHALRLVKPIGTRSPLHASSTGKSVMAYLTPAELDSYRGSGLPAVTSHTITDWEALTAELKQIREQGYAISDEELTEGIVSIAACIKTANGRPFASISISAPAGRIPPESRAGFGRRVAAAAAEVADQL